MFNTIIDRLTRQVLVFHQLKHLSLAQWDVESGKCHMPRIERQHLKYRLY